MFLVLTSLFTASYMANSEDAVTDADEELLPYLQNHACTHQRGSLQLPPNSSAVLSYVVNVSRDSSNSMQNIGGMVSAKRDLMTGLVLPFYLRGSGSHHMQNRILLYGAPGTGKTSLAKALAHTLGIPLINVSASSLECKYYGESSKLVKTLFRTAEAIRPCIMFFDEIDGMLRKRNDADASFVYSMKTELLAAMDGVHKLHGDVIIIASTNHEAALDPAIYRRLPFAIEVATPSQDELVDIIQKINGGDWQLSTGETESLAVGMYGFTGCDVKSVLLEARNIHNESLLGIASAGASDGAIWRQALHKVRGRMSIRYEAPEDRHVSDLWNAIKGSGR